MDVTIDGERTKLPDDDDLTLGESEEVAKHLGIDLGTSLPTQKFIGLVFVAIRRKLPDGAIVDQIQAVRNMKIRDLEISKEEIEGEVGSVFPLPVDADVNGRSETIPEPSGVPA